MNRAAGWTRKSQEIRTNIAKGNVDNLFEDENFVLDLLKVLHDDTVDSRIKTELLTFLESYGGVSGIQPSSADQIIGSLLDVFNQQSGGESGQSAFQEQILMTVTSLMIQLDQLGTDIFKTCCQTLLSVATTGVNSSDTKRLRSCACHCLIQFEDWLPGCLWKEKDVFLKVMRQDRTNVYQEYSSLVIKMVEHIICSRQYQTVAHPGNGNGIDRQYSVDQQEIRQTVSMVMDNAALFTTSGLWHIFLSLVSLVQNLPELSPMIFKPMMLHHMASLNVSLLHLVLYLQREFEKEVLTEDEERQLLQQLLTAIKHPALTPIHRLFVCHWTRHLSQTCDDGDSFISDDLSDQYQLEFFPSVFDPPDCQLAKICLLNGCLQSLATKPDGIAAGLLLSSVGCLHKLVWHTGSDRVAVVLFRALFQMYQRHCSKSFSEDINRFLRGLISGFPYFIPHALDFIESLKDTTPDSPMYLEILGLLHQQVVTTPEDQAATYHYFYLQVLKSASLQKEISPKMTIKFLSYLSENSTYVDDGSWLLGNSILAVCHHLLTCHGTEDIYEDIGDLLFYMMTHYRDTDVKDKAMFLYILLTSSTDEKIQDLLKTRQRAHSFHQALSNLLPGTISREENQIIDLESPILQWKRVSVVADIVYPDDNVLDTTSGEEELLSYCQRLQQCKTVLKANYSIELVGDKCTKVFAATIHIEQNSNMERVKEINIPSISNEGVHEVLFTVCPTKPVPTTCKSWVEFLDGKQTYSCTLGDLILTMEDVMLPLQTRLFTANHSNDNSETRRRLFDQLWQWCTNNNVTTDGICSLESIKTLPVTLSEFKSTKAEKLQPFSIPSSDANEISFGMYLPPQYHLLMKCSEVNSRTVISMATDIHYALPFVDTFLTSL